MNPPLATGQTISIAVHGEPETASRAKVMAISKDRLVIVLAFLDHPAIRFPLPVGGFVVQPSYGFLMQLSRIQFNGVPWGPWIDDGSGMHFEIDPVEETDS